MDCPKCLAIAEGLNGSDEIVDLAARSHQQQNTDCLANDTRVERSGEHARLPVFSGYQIIQKLGHGGTGIVYKAREEKLKRLVALKVVRTVFALDDSERRRLRAEAEMVARLHHPNIVQIHCVGEEKGQPFLSLEYVDGSTLREFTTDHELSRKEVADLCETIARAIQSAHEQGVVHRDLKPENILLAVPRNRFADRSKQPTSDSTHSNNSLANRRSGKEWTFANIVKITDFGLAKMLDSEERHTLTGTVLGTACYMSPEQAGGRIRDIGPATDIYAVGAMLYELLTGRTPFYGEGYSETIQLVLNEDPTPPRRLKPHVDRDIDTICMKCLEKNPAQRYASAEELADDLRRYRDGHPISARPATTLDQLGRWYARNPYVAVLSMVCVALLLVISGFLVRPLSSNRSKLTSDGLARASLVPGSDSNGDSAQDRPRSSLAADKTKPFTENIDENVALWAFGIGAYRVNVRTPEGQFLETENRYQLPTEYRIEEIDFRHIKSITNAQLIRLEGLQHLRRLVLLDTSVDDGGLAYLSKVPSIEHLDLAILPGITANGLKHLKALPNLRKLYLWRNKVTRLQINALAELTDLTRLNFSSGTLTDDDLEPLARLSKLRELEILPSELEGSYLRFFAGHSNLKSVLLHSSKLTVEGVSALHELQQIEKVNFEKSRFTNEHLWQLVGLKKLHHIYLNGAQIDDDSAKAFLSIPKLRRLRVQASPLTDDFMRQVSRMGSLTYFDATSTPISDAGLKYLEPLKRLDYVFIEGTAATERGVASLRYALPGCRVVSDFD